MAIATAEKLAPGVVPQAQERTAFLIENLGSAATLAELLRVNRSQTTRWRNGTDLPSPMMSRLLLDVDHIFARTRMLWGKDAALAWLTGNNAFLGGARPVDVLRSRGTRDVLDALDAELAGSFA